ncbi:hypothetical protein BDZ88DRAFT_423655 [Geranomyces variabilis]|nr:hypothetical protein BDZ88DRAFT_423655 [Geranomyces variabilis]
MSRRAFTTTMIALVSLNAGTKTKPRPLTSTLMAWPRRLADLRSCTHATTAATLRCLTEEDSPSNSTLTVERGGGRVCLH